MTVEHFEFLFEETSMEQFLAQALPGMLNGRATFAIHAYQGKSDLLGKLGSRLRGYAKWLPDNMSVVVVVDRDDDNCEQLKLRLETEAQSCGMLTRSAGAGGSWRVLNRIAIEELEAWFFGEWSAVRGAYPRVRATVPAHASYRDSDAILGGTWEALERILRSAGYFSGGLRKIEAARAIGRHYNSSASTSQSFIAFRDAITEVIADPIDAAEFTETP